jgi:uncharacterized delta-60 repeat protein
MVTVSKKFYMKKEASMKRFLLILLTLFSANLYSSTPTSLDTSYDGFNYATASIGYSSEAYGIAIQSDGKTVLTGVTYSSAGVPQLFIARYNVDQTLDLTFNAGSVNGAPGYTTLFIGSQCIAYGIALDANQNIVVAGFAQISGSNNILVARYLPSGLIDSYANDTTSPFGSATPSSASGYVAASIGISVKGFALAIQDDGSIIVTGTSQTSPYPMVTVRYLTNGLLDTIANGGTGFGAGSPAQGYVTTLVGTQAIAYAIALQTDGTIVIAGTAYTSDSQQMVAARYTAAGLPDITFNTSGYTVIFIGNQSIAYGVAIQSNGKIILAGQAILNNTSTVGLVQLTTSGLLDETFGINGIVTTPFQSGAAAAFALGLQPNGQIVITGVVQSGGLNLLLFAFYNADGSLDTTINNTGYITQSIAYTCTSYALAIAANNIMVAGYDATSSELQSDIVQAFSAHLNISGHQITAVGVSPSYYTLTPGEFVPFLNNTANISVFDNNSAVIQQATVNSTTTSYEIFNDAESWSVVGLGLLTNNTGATATNLNFYDNTNSLLTSVASIANGTTIPIPVGATSATCTALINSTSTNITLSISDAISSNTNMLSDYVVTNSSGSTISVIYYGTVNGIPNTQLNSLAISVSNSSFVHIITGATSVSVLASSTPVISAASINPNTSYTVTDSGVWAITTTASTATLTNNFSAATGNLSFYNVNGTPLVTISSLAAFASTAIPVAAVSASVINSTSSTIFLNAISTLANSNIYGTGTITNNTGSTIDVVYFSPLDGGIAQLNNPEIPITPASTTQNITGATIVDIVSDGITVLNQISMNSATSYTVTDTDGVWSIRPTTALNLTNNSLETVTNLQFFSADRTQVGSTISSLAASSSTSIPTSSVVTHATFNYPSAGTLTIPLSTTVSSNIFANYSLYNGTSQTLSAALFGTLPTRQSNRTIDAYPLNTINFASTAYASTLQTDGKLVIAGFSENSGTNQICVARYLTNGFLDSTFNGTGFVTTTIGTTDATAYGVTVDANGKIVVAGVANNQICVARYLSNGLLDSYANDATAPFGSATPSSAPGYFIASIGTSSAAQSLTIDRNGNIVVAGYAIISDVQQMVVARLLPTGVLDTANFNTSNGYVTSIIGTASSANGIALQADGKIVIAGYSQTSDVSRIAVVRYTTHGVLDTTFNSFGYVTTLVGTSCQANDLVLQSNGNIIVTGKTAFNNVENIIVARYTTNGILDTSFGTAGYNTMLAGTNSTANSLLLQTDQKILVTGQAIVSDIPQVIVGRFTPIGLLDTSFSSTGYVTTAIGSDSQGFSVELQPDRKIIVAGYGTLFNSNQIAVARYFGNVLPAQTTPNAASLYGSNPNLYTDFLYVDYLLAIITDPTTQEAVRNSIESILSTYVRDYQLQPSFNYLANMSSLLDTRLNDSQAILIANYPDYTTQITAVFTALDARIASYSNTSN